MNNLTRINTTFQDCCLPLLLSTTHPCMILCDFPSRILDPPPNISIFGLDDFSMFLNTALAHPECCIYVLTQQTYTLRKLLSPPSPLPQPFWFLTRTSSNSPFELKIIEIFNSLPNGMQDRISQLYFINTFSVTLTGKKGPWIKQFDLFHLLLDPCALSVAIEIPTPPPFLQDFQTYNALVFQASPTKLEEALLAALDIGVSDKDFSNLKSIVLKDITSKPALHPHLVEKWYPKNLPKLESPAFWHKVFHRLPLFLHLLLPLPNNLSPLFHPLLCASCKRLILCINSLLKLCFMNIHWIFSLLPLFPHLKLLPFLFFFPPFILRNFVSSH